MRDFIVITTQDGNTLARCPRLNLSVSAKSADEALAKLRALAGDGVTA